MSDRLAEAVEFYGPAESYTGHEEVVLSAARRVLSARQIQWCETHRMMAVNASGECHLAHHETPQRVCSFVDRLILDPED